LNRLPQFRAEANGLGLHFVHLRGSGPDPMPLILSHGWPGSFMEFLHVAEPLADSERFGRSGGRLRCRGTLAAGYAFSDRPARPVGPRTTARCFDVLMTRVLA
jgi:pimeloyl-ACP methyl ester carboxylesterase